MYARPGEDFSDHANVHKLLGHMVDSGVAAGYEKEEEGDREAGRRWGRPPKGSSIYDCQFDLQNLKFADIQAQNLADVIHGTFPE